MNASLLFIAQELTLVESDLASVSNSTLTSSFIFALDHDASL